MPEFLPPTDHRLVDWMPGFLRRLESLGAESKLSEKDLRRLKKKSAEFSSVLSEFRRLYNSTGDALKRKDDCRRELEAMIQEVLGQGDSGSVAPVRESASETPNRPTKVRNVKVTRKPQVRLMGSVGLVTIQWGMDVSSGLPSGMPSGVSGANVYRRKRGEKEFVLRGFASSSPYYDQITGKAQTWEYVLEYVGPKGTGPKSEPVEIMARGLLAA